MMSHGEIMGAAFGCNRIHFSASQLTHITEPGFCFPSMLRSRRPLGPTDGVRGMTLHVTVRSSPGDKPSAVDTLGCWHSASLTSLWRHDYTGCQCSVHLQQQVCMLSPLYTNHWEHKRAMTSYMTWFRLDHFPWLNNGEQWSRVNHRLCKYSINFKGVSHRAGWWQIFLNECHSSSRRNQNTAITRAFPSLSISLLCDIL